MVAGPALLVQRLHSMHIHAYVRLCGWPRYLPPQVHMYPCTLSPTTHTHTHSLSPLAYITHTRAICHTHANTHTGIPEQVSLDLDAVVGVVRPAEQAAQIGLGLATLPPALQKPMPQVRQVGAPPLPGAQTATAAGWWWSAALLQRCGAIKTAMRAFPHEYTPEQLCRLASRFARIHTHRYMLRALAHLCSWPRQ